MALPFTVDPTTLVVSKESQIVVNALFQLTQAIRGLQFATLLNTRAVANAALLSWDAHQSLDPTLLAAVKLDLAALAQASIVESKVDPTTFVVTPKVVQP